MLLAYLGLRVRRFTRFTAWVGAALMVGLNFAMLARRHSLRLIFTDLPRGRRLAEA